MSELDQTQESEQQTQQPPSTEHQPGTPPAEFKFGDDAPEYLRGRSPAEAIDVFNRIVEEARGLYARAQQPQTPMEQPQQMPQPEPLDADMILTQPDKWQAQFAQTMQHTLQSQMAQAAAPIMTAQRESARWMSQSDKANATVFDKWGKEVDALVEQAYAAGATPSKALYDQAAKMVKANHLDELVAEQMERAAAAAPQTARAGGDDGGTVDSAADTTLWEKVEKHPHGKALMGAVGKAGIVRTAQSQGWKLEDYLNSIVNSRTRHDPMKPGVWTTEVV